MPTRTWVSPTSATRTSSARPTRTAARSRRRSRSWSGPRTRIAGSTRRSTRPPRERVPLTIRRATGADAPAVADVWLRSFASAYTFPAAHPDDDVRRWIREQLIGDHETWVAEDERGIVGLSSLSPGWVDQLYIDPSAQGEGIG